MLKLMRDRFKSLKVVLWFVVFVFVAYFVADFGGLIFSNPDEQQYAARLGDIRIPEADFQREYRQTLDRYRQMYQQSWKPELAAQLNLPQQTLDGLIYRHVLLAEARENGLDATDDEVRERLRQAFSRNGEFIGRAEYESRVRSLGLTTGRFEQLMRQDIILGKLNALLEQSMLVTEAQIAEEFGRQKDRAKIAYVKQGLEPFLAVQFDEAALKTYYEANREKYRSGEKRKIKYLLVENFKLAQELKATDEEMLAYYEAHRNEYSNPEQVTASHILFKVPEGASPAAELEVQQRAREVYEKAVAPGGDFAALARAHTEEPGGKERGGDLGTFPRGRMVKEFEDVAFALPSGGVSEPVKSQFGYHVIKVGAKMPAGVQTFEEVKPRLNAAVVQPRLKQAARERAETLGRQIAEKNLTTDEQLRALATGAVTFNETPLFAKGEPLPGFGRAPELGKAVFELGEGKVTSVVDTPRGPVIAKVAQVRAAGIPAFEDLRDQLAGDYRRDTAARQARAKLDAVAEAVRGGATLEQAAAAAGLTVTTSEEFGRGGAVPELGASRELDEAVFAAAPGALGGPLAVADGALVIFRVVEKKSFEKAELDKERAGLRDRLRSEELGRFLQAIVNRAKSREALYVNEELMKRFASAA